MPSLTRRLYLHSARAAVGQDGSVFREEGNDPPRLVKPTVKAKTVQNCSTQEVGGFIHILAHRQSGTTFNNEVWTSMPPGNARRVRRAPHMHLTLSGTKH